MKIKNFQSDIIIKACAAVEKGKIEKAKEIISTNYPYSNFKNNLPETTVSRNLKVFMRDGFIDRYTGEKVILPVALSLLSFIIPDVFPLQKNWKYEGTHQAFYTIRAAVDKVNPADDYDKDLSTLVTTSYSNKIAKSNANLSDIGWKLLSLEEIEKKRWDGLSGWFMKYLEEHPKFINRDPKIKEWYENLLKHQIREEKNFKRVRGSELDARKKLSTAQIEDF